MSLLEFNIEDFQPSGSLGTYKEKPDSELETKMLAKPLREMHNVQLYIQHEMAQSDYGYDEDDSDHPLSELNWTSQARGKYVKFIMMNSTDTKHFKANSNQKLVRGKRVHSPHSKMRHTSDGLVELSTSQQNHMSVSKC